ncbi:hypothetical protein D3C81_754430 [compost metagenome]
MTALAPGQLQRLIEQGLSLCKIACIHGKARQDAMAQQHRQPVLAPKIIKGCTAMQARRPGLSTQGLQGAEQRLPVRQQALIAYRVGQRQKMPQTRQALGGFVQPPTEQQGLGAQIDQTRAAVQQLRLDALTPIHQFAQVPFSENPAQPQALHVIGSYLRLIGTQCLLHRVVDMPEHTEQLTGPQAQPVQRRTAQLALQGLRHRG